ncbi:MAG: outer membrane beta-barrel protein [Pseudomonadota bacterium]
MKLAKGICALVAGAFFAGGAVAQDWYVSGSAGVSFQSDSDNFGTTGAFTTGDIGDGSTIDVAAGTDYGWTTEFDAGFAVAGEAGARFGQGFRAGFEISYTDANVDTHRDVTLGGGPIGALDAAALAGAPAPLGVTIADLVADGQGDITSLAFMANLYYDLNLGGRIQPYVGAGVGVADVDVDYSPSGVVIIDDGETKFAYQFKAGATYKATQALDLFAEYVYRATDDIEVDNALFPGTLEIENQQNMVLAGARLNF